MDLYVRLTQTSDFGVAVLSLKNTLRFSRMTRFNTSLIVFSCLKLTFAFDL